MLAFCSTDKSFAAVELSYLKIFLIDDNWFFCSIPEWTGLSFAIRVSQTERSRLIYMILSKHSCFCIDIKIITVFLSIYKSLHIKS